MTLVFVGHRCCDHSPSSGYDQVRTLFPDAGWLDGRSLADGSLRWEREPPGFATMNPLLHVLYGDCSGSALPPILRTLFPAATIVSTVHRPVSRLLQDRIARQSLDVVDGVIAVSQSQRRQLTELPLTAQIYAIAHGMWTSIFRPAPSSIPPPRDYVLLVGNYLRDWSGANRIVTLLAARGIRSIVLGSTASEMIDASNPMVQVTPRVDEAQLARFYDRAVALMLPVLDLTASNALLEAMAAGCPIICPRLPAAAEYLPDDSDTYEQGDYHTAALRAVHYHESPAHRASRSLELVRRSEMFDWEQLRPRLQAVYRALTERTPSDARA